MHSLLIRKITPELKSRLHARAALHQRSIEAEARMILADGLAELEQPMAHWAVQMNALFGAEHGVELNLPARDTPRAPPDMSMILHP
jgi:plasmid stability protein